MNNKTKKDRRDRYDRIYLKDLDSMHKLMPYIMPRRCDNEAVLDEVIDITAINEYIAKKNAENPDFKYTWFHVITAALAKVIILRPKMNWFISGDRLYERRNIEVCFIVKRAFEDDSDETIAKCIIDRNGGGPIEQVHSFVRDFVTKVRKQNQNDGATDIMDVVAKMPRPILRFFFWILNRMEYHGRFPKSLAEVDPRYGTVFISNLGSIKMNADYHHIYECGTMSFFCVISEKTMRPIFNPDGTYEMRDTIKLGLTVDERIADGYYFAKSIRLLRYLLQHPDLLELDAATNIDFEQKK